MKLVAEAVIISGPRKGEFIAVSEEAIAEPSAEVVEALNAALKGLDAALIAAIEETRAWRRCGVKEKALRMANWLEILQNVMPSRPRRK